MENHLTLNHTAAHCVVPMTLTINNTFIENEKIVRQRLVDILRHGVSNGQIDPELSIENTASWLMTIADGAIGRDLMEPEFHLADRLGSFIYIIKKILMPIK